MYYETLLYSSRIRPDRLDYPGPWTGHVPFALWLIQVLKPHLVVELGTYRGVSYFNFCLGVKTAGIRARCYGVDTWQGDEHSGYYGEDIFSEVNAHGAARYSDISNLLRMKFDEALPYFADGSIDLLHIDGLHTYEAVKHDFECWLPKLAPAAVVLFHDTNVRERGFGVWRFWEEVSLLYPRHIQFFHSHGLGVLQLAGGGGAVDLDFLLPEAPERAFLADYFANCGADLIRLQANRQLERTVAQLNGTVASLNQRLSETVASLNQAVVERDRSIRELTLGDTREDSAQIAKLQQHIDRLTEQLADCDQALAEQRLRMGSLVASRSWWITKPLRVIGRILKGESTTASASFVGRQANRMARLVQRMGDTGTAIDGGRGGRSAPPPDNEDLVIPERAAATTTLHGWGVIATPHTLFVAELIANRLRRHGWSVEIRTDMPDSFSHEWYVVVCPQMFDTLPPGARRFVVQMEQSVTARWFTDAYLEVLRTSCAVLDYSTVNLEYLAGQDILYPHVYYLPIGALASYGRCLAGVTNTCDVLFYGDSDSCPRRRRLLDALSAQFDLREVRGVFGSEMLELIKGARLVINLHYYENALLELPRIAECLSLGVPVLSESAQDQGDYPELVGAVGFFQEGSVSEMLSAVAAMLKDPPLVSVIAECSVRSAERFAFMFDRFLVGRGLLSASYATLMDLPLANGVDHVILGLPETVVRRRWLEAVRPAGYAVFDGLRRTPGWVGCALSYAGLARHAIRRGIPRLTVMEDDVLLPADFEAKMAVVEEFLAAREGDWDLFSGLIAALHANVKVLSVETFNGLTFVTIDKMTSMVFNIYGGSVLGLMASWDGTNLDAEGNTIDRFLEARSDLRVVVTLPYLVGHREDVQSTLWGFQNTAYLDMIRRSERELQGLVADWHRGRTGADGKGVTAGLDT